MKRVAVEPESAGLRAYLAACDGRGDLLTSSSLAWVEVWRALRRAAVMDVDGAGELAMSGIAEFELTAPSVYLARRIGPDQLRSLDAIHLAAAVQAGVQVLVTYDQRLADAGVALGFDVIAPA